VWGQGRRYKVRGTLKVPPGGSSASMTAYRGAIEIQPAGTTSGSYGTMALKILAPAGTVKPTLR
jgi:hypothetical protein